MKELFNYYPLREYEEELTDRYGSLETYLKETRLDGIELFLPKELHTELKQETVGVHLPYLPFWLDLWYGDSERLNRQFFDEEEQVRYLGGANDRETWCGRVRQSLARADAYEPEYLVWHVSEANREEIFTRDFYYTDDDVIDATAELFQAVSDVIPKDSIVLFENLWWPGLRLTEPRIVEKLFDKIDSERVGIMLDTGHLLNTDVSLRTEEEGADYILRTLDRLGSLAGKIRGIHLQCSLSGEYVQSALRVRPHDLSPQEECHHIVAIDNHRPFETSAMRRVIERVDPDWLVHELYYDSLQHMQTMLRQEKKLLNL